MNTLAQEMLINFEQLPSDMQYEVIDFIDFLKQKSQKGIHQDSKTTQIQSDREEDSDETDYVLNNLSLMRQIAASQKTFAAKTGFIPSQEQLNAFD
jgi:hypothetical protein